MNLRTFAFISTFFIWKVCFCQDLVADRINKMLNDPLMKGAGIGIFVLNQENDSVLYDINSTTSLVPASILKLVTSSAALEILGSDYTFKTKLAKTGKINDSNILEGDLVVIGGGDPTLGSEYFPEYFSKSHFPDQWIDAIKSEGIQGIKGNICLDESIYEDQTIPDTWIWGDIGNYYGAGICGISAYDNTFRITFRSDKESGKPAEIIDINPKVKGLEFENYVLSSDINSDRTNVYGVPLGGKEIVNGTIPKGQDNFVIKASLPEPGLVLGNDLKTKLEENEIFVSGEVKKCKTPSDIIPFYKFESPPLSEIIKVLNHESVNLFAEHLVKQIAYEKTGLGSTEEGVKLIKDFWKERGIETNGMFQEDGSGLSRYNAISPKQIVDILNYMKTESPNAGIFINSLPTAGEGTLVVFNPDNFPSECLKCKSGSMTRVRCYAGYLKTDFGKELIFAIMANNFSMSQSLLIHKIEELLVGIRMEN
jgi:serine-type D-Ala-D-Ala carboxypeptidase/endopeptidase (penicillin-binding protein 4)